jgi:integrase
MSIQKKGNRYYACVYAGYVNGKRVYEWSDGFIDKKDAKMEESKIIETVISKGCLVKTKTSFNEIADIWFEMREKTVANSTYQGEKLYYKMYMKDYFKGKSIKKIDPLAVTKFMLTLNHAPATVVKTMNILSLIFKFAVDMKIIYYNPCIGIKKPKILRPKHHTWDEDTISKFLSNEAVQKHPLYTAYAILFTTGMRPGEVCGLRWCDFHEDYFTPDIGIDRYGKETSLKNEKAHEKVYIPDYLIPLINRHKRAQKAVFFSHGKKVSNKSFINCLEPDMRAIKPDYLSNQFNKLVVECKLPRITLYEARHSFGTNLMKNDVNPKKVAELMRHTSVKTTLDNYSHVDDDMKKKEINSYGIKISM